MQSQILRVSKRSPCPICGKPDWCGLTEDGRYALCARTSIGSISLAKNGAYLHPLSLTMSRQVSAIPAPAIRGRGTAEVERANANHIDVVYRELLKRLRLLPHHGDHLLKKRQLSDTTIANNFYASVPNMGDAQMICSELECRFDLTGIPGFYKRYDRWQLNAHGDGFLVPYKNASGLIVGSQIRRFDAEPKYIWLSSAGKEGGASSGSPLHFAKPDLAQLNGFAVITEGALKADVISEHWHCAVIALAGVSAVNPEKFVSQLQQSLPELRKIAVAFDSDWRAKREVRNALRRLLYALQSTSLIVNVLDWDAVNGKGFDDFLNKEEREKAA